MLPRHGFASSLLAGLPVHRRIHTLSRPVTKFSFVSKSTQPNHPIFTRGIRSYPRPNNNRSQSSPFTTLTDAINRLPSSALVIGIIAVNGVVFIMWQGAKGEAVSSTLF
jgi:hypothetical protein